MDMFVAADETESGGSDSDASFAWSPLLTHARGAEQSRRLNQSVLLGEVFISSLQTITASEW